MPSLPRRRAALLAAALVVAASGACSSGGSEKPAGMVDPAAQAPAVPVPDWFPRRFVAPAGARVVDVIERPEPGLGRTVTWRVPGRFDDVVTQVERVLANLGWSPVERTETDDEGSRRTSWFIENGEVYAVRVYEDEVLEGVRLTVELPADS